MSFQKKFPKILEKTYKSCKDQSLKEIPAVELNSKIFESKIVSLPFLDTMIPIHSLDEDALKELAKYPKVEIRLSESNSNLGQLRGILNKLGFKANIVKGHMISILTNKEDFWQRFKKQTRKDIRKSKKKNLKVEQIKTLKELKKFYKLYFKEMKIFGTPQHSFYFFKNCFQMLKDDFIGWNCYMQNKLIGAIILFIEGDSAYVAFNVSDKRGKNFGQNDLLYWESIKWCMQKKIKYFDIGQIDFNPKKGSREESLLSFKKKWLGQEYEKIYFTKGFKYEQDKKNSLKKFRKIWSRLPNFIIKLVGPKICSQLG